MPRRSKAAARVSQALSNLAPESRIATRRQIAYDVVHAFRRLVPKARRVLFEILDNPETPPRDRIRAAEVILDRALGKAPSTTVHAVVSRLEQDQAQLEQAALEIMQRRGIVDAQLPKALPPGDIPQSSGTTAPPSSGTPEEKSERQKRKLAGSAK